MYTVGDILLNRIGYVDGCFVLLQSFAMESIKKVLIRSIIRYLVRELQSNRELDVDQRDSLEVAIQCLECIYNLEGQRDNVVDTVDLLEVVQKFLVNKSAEQVSCTGTEFRGLETLNPHTCYYSILLQHFCIFRVFG